jgi:alanine racemase
MSHLADSDGPDPATVHAAVAAFDECVGAVHATGLRPQFVHVAQSAGSLKAESAYANTMRLGIGLYGLNPFGRRHAMSAKLSGLQPALRFISTVTKIIDLQPGDKVSYNYVFTAPHAMKIAVIPVGYYEGINRSLSNKGVVKIGKHFAPIVGRVCMNHTMLNLDGIDAKVGDEVVVYSDDPADKNAIDTIATEHSLFNYNLLTALSPDVRRQLVD